MSWRMSAEPMNPAPPVTTIRAPARASRDSPVWVTTFMMGPSNDFLRRAGFRSPADAQLDVFLHQLEHLARSRREQAIGRRSARLVVEDAQLGGDPHRHRRGSAILELQQAVLQIVEEVA